LEIQDAGAMRIPNMPYMDRVTGAQNWSVVSYVNSHVRDPADAINLIPYIFSTNNTIQLYNNISVHSNVIPSATTFHVLTNEGGNIPPSEFAVLNPDKIYGDAIAELVNALQQNLDEGFNKLMEFDQLSVRAYLLQKGFTNAQINWLETIEEGTLSFDKASLAQAVIEQWIFTAAPLDSWVTVNGGFERLINGLLKVLHKPPKLLNRVTAIKPGRADSLTVVVNHTSEHSYDHVISTIPLGATRVLDTSTLPDLYYNTTMAWRTLAYDDAGKIGIWFKTRWWENPDVLAAPFIGGQSSTDLPIRRCVYPSYGLDVPNAPGTMIASYTWSQDADRLASFYQSADQEEFITHVVLEDMARLHNVSVSFLQDQLVEAHLWDWYSQPYSVGAYALFSPAQFSDVLPPLMRPSCKGRLHTAGEATSSGHAWVVGALNSAYRAVMEVLAVEGRTDLIEKMIEIWGSIDEVDMGWFESPNP
jgi:monoamine oxidase